ncbi:hypothetical protein AHF37_12426 [Paragonimus kellicotti]|nr:hypothetical protein AHF37_12426 [Paragonimus kellicotti]
MRLHCFYLSIAFQVKLEKPQSVYICKRPLSPTNIQLFGRTNNSFSVTRLTGPC